MAKPEFGLGHHHVMCCDRQATRVFMVSVIVTRLESHISQPSKLWTTAHVLSPFFQDVKIATEWRTSADVSDELPSSTSGFPASITPSCACSAHTMMVLLTSKNRQKKEDHSRHQEIDNPSVWKCLTYTLPPNKNGTWSTVATSRTKRCQIGI